LGTDIVQKMSTEIELNCSFDCLGFCRGAMVPCIMLVLGGNLVGGEFCYQNFHPIIIFMYYLLPQATGRQPPWLQDINNLLLYIIKLLVYWGVLWRDWSVLHWTCCNPRKLCMSLLGPNH
jgi:hypothetical protein